MIDLGALTISLVTGIPLSIYLNNNFFNEQYRVKKRITKDLKEIFEEKKLCNSKNTYPKVLDLKLFNYGFKVSLDIKKVCTYEDVEKLEEFIKSTYEAIEVNIINYYSYIDIEVINKPVEEVVYKYIPLQSWELLLGFNLKGEAITVDMKKVPHLLITGLSNQGKSYMVKTILRNLQGIHEVIVLNGFREDYLEFKDIRHLVHEEDIKKLLEEILEAKRVYKKPLYIVIEELSSIKDKAILKAIKELLAYGRHYNIFVVGVVQISTKEEFNSKSYFNARVSFKQIEASSYQVCLGVTVQEQLSKREFYLVADGVYRGKTYSLL